MTKNHFKHFATPDKLIAVDAGSTQKFHALALAFPALEVFRWDSSSSETENFNALVQRAVAIDRSRILVAGCSVEQSCLVISLLALGHGFDVYLCVDLVDGPDRERHLLKDRLRQHGAMIVSEKQVFAEFSAAAQTEKLT